MKQQFELYTEEDRNVWSLLFERQVTNLQDKACGAYLKALEQLSPVLNAAELPHFDKMNAWLRTHTGREIYCVPGLIEVDAFFELLAQQKFPSSTWLRSLDKLDYLEEPDMFHDIFGHIPLLCQPNYARFMHDFGKIGVQYASSPVILSQLQRLYWFTIEFGLLRENDGLKILGAGILSSFYESMSSISNKEIVRKPFELKEVLATGFCTSEIQQQYFVLDSMEQLEATRLFIPQHLHHELDIDC